MKTFKASTVEYVEGYGVCFICTSEPFEKIKAGTEVNISFPFRKCHVVKANGDSIRVFGSAWAIPVKSEELWCVINAN